MSDVDNLHSYSKSPSNGNMNERPELPTFMKSHSYATSMFKPHKKKKPDLKKVLSFQNMKAQPLHQGKLIPSLPLEKRVRWTVAQVSFLEVLASTTNVHTHAFWDVCAKAINSKFKTSRSGASCRMQYKTAKRNTAMHIAARKHQTPATYEDKNPQPATSEDNNPQLATSEDTNSQLATSEDNNPQLATSEDNNPQLATSEDTNSQLATSEDNNSQLATSEDNNPQLATSEDNNPQLATIEDTNSQLATSEDNNPQLATSEDTNSQLETFNETDPELEVHSKIFWDACSEAINSEVNTSQTGGSCRIQYQSRNTTSHVAVEHLSACKSPTPQTSKEKNPHLATLKGTGTRPATHRDKSTKIATNTDDKCCQTLLSMLFTRDGRWKTVLVEAP